MRMVVVVLALGAGCSSGASPGSDLAAPATDLAVPADLAVAPWDGAGGDAGGAELCVGSVARAVYRGQRLEALPVTSSRPLFDCCDGGLVRFHLEAQGGGQAAIMVREFGGVLHTASFSLDRIPAGVEVRLLQGTTYIDATLAGTVAVVAPAGLDDPLHLSLCVDVRADGHALDGARFYVPAFPVMAVSAEGGVRLRLLQDRALSANQALRAAIDSLVLENDALVDLYSIGWYQRASHTMFWDNLGNTTALRNRLGPVPTRGVPFVIEADGRRVYVGAFFSRVSSESFAGPAVVMEDLVDAGFTLAPGYPPRVLDPDRRQDPGLLRVLAEVGKLE